MVHLFYSRVHFSGGLDLDPVNVKLVATKQPTHIMLLILDGSSDSMPMCGVN